MGRLQVLHPMSAAEAFDLIYAALGLGLGIGLIFSLI